MRLAVLKREGKLRTIKLQRNKNVRLGEHKILNEPGKRSLNARIHFQMDSFLNNLKIKCVIMY